MVSTEFTLESINPYRHFSSFINTEMVQVVETLTHGKQKCA